MTFEQYQAEVARTGDIYIACPACSGDKATFPVRRIQADDVVFNCVECGAVFGRVASWLDYVKFTSFGGLGSGDAARYFDFTRVFTGERFHGWTDETDLVVQIG